MRLSPKISFIVHQNFSLKASIEEINMKAVTVTIKVPTVRSIKFYFVKTKIFIIQCAILIIIAFSSTVQCGEEEEQHDEHQHHHHMEEHHMPKHIHTVHHHHTVKETIIKKVQVPVIKEVKVPYYVYEPIKVPYAYYVKPYIVKVPIEYYKEEKHEHIHPKEESHHHDDDEEEEEHHEEKHEDKGHKDHHGSESHISVEKDASDGHLRHREQFESAEDDEHYNNESSSNEH